MLWGQIPTWGHLGSQGSKGHFHQNCFNLSILNSLTIYSKHMHEPETPTYVVGSKINLGSLGIRQKRAEFVSFQRHTVLVFLPCPRSGAGSYIASVSFLPCPRSGAGSYIASVSFFFFFLLLSSSSFFFYLSTCQYLRHPRSDYAHTWSK